MGQITELPDIDGTISDQVYLVQYDEDLWMKYSDEDKQHCLDTWRKKAEVLDVKRVVLKIHPDILFPRYGNTRPYIAWQHRFPNEELGWEISKHIKIQTNTDQVALTQGDIERIVEYQKEGYSVEVRNCNGSKLW